MSEKDDVWSALPPEDSEDLLQLGITARFPSGDVILRQGEPSTHAVVLREGVAKVVAQTEDGTEVALGLRMSPNIVGEMAAMDGKPRSASVIALSDVTAGIVTSEQFNAFLTERPETLRALMGIVMTRLRESDHARQELVTQTVMQRVAARLIDLAGHLGVKDEQVGTVRVRVDSQQELASWAGASREGVVRALRMLRQQGVATTERRYIVIHDMDALKALADD
ncbi:Crp/Fnr family transcriptional regulator [Streptomyces sp. NPDC003077]|uniref:Crp/Fnr family transcriptional regulator n=1 Tax=Streptomyces sp. NPDC003077 TaxID=3154443 RepID=UPI0033BD0FEA